MANVGVGYKSYLGIAKETTWGTGVAPDTFLEFLDCSLKKTIASIESGANVGGRFKRHIDVDGSVDVSGDFSIEVNPDNIGLLVGGALGTEGDATQVGATTAYDHEFTPGDTLVPLTVEVYKDTLAQTSDKAQRFSGCNVNTMALSCDINAYLKATFGIVGKDMSEETKSSASYSSLKSYVFKQSSVEIDSSSVNYVKKFDLNLNNNLYTDRYVMNSSNLRVGLQPQSSDITGTIEIESTQTAYAAEIAKYLANTDTSLTVTFTSDEEIETGYYYTITISIPHVKYRETDESISGKDIIPVTLNWEAWYNGSDDIITITLRDKLTTKWTA